ncbi:S1 RNA-binding domain-containing protein [Alkalibacter rhizosphaerae]|uniref:S1 RNA-binding domain-containing protein n=1 Tax=Alkalibacter rhizosphaerae TaxID=2815577 RepID=A0A974XCX6_9FIRM|nr:S1 RNA-binding domain-containing protein [Alkalibacter rhizosphaerae]QSX07421.1 S1 RNA-binding domain-containing protein [Alkalibacter rhizosphaerae]
MPFEVNQVVEGVVKSITNFGAFIDLGGKTGLVHISEVADGYVKEISDYLKQNDTVKVKIISISEGKIGLSIRQAQPKKEEAPRAPKPSNYRKSAPVNTAPVTIEDKISQFLKDSDERQQALKKSAKKGKNKSFNR